MAYDGTYRDPSLDWLDLVQPVGLVFAPMVLKEKGLTPERLTSFDSKAYSAFIDGDDARPALLDVWALFAGYLGWTPKLVAGAPGGPPVPEDLFVDLGDHHHVKPDWAVLGFGEDAPWQMLVKFDQGKDGLDKRGGDGAGVSVHQTFERLLRETGVHVGLIVGRTVLRFVYAPRGETSGYLDFPLREMATVAGRPILAGLRMVLSSFRLFNAPTHERLSAILKASREAQAAVSTTLAEQVLGALHELLRGLDAAAPDLIRDLAKREPQRLYEGLLTVLLRLVFILYAEDRELLPSSREPKARTLYQKAYSVRGLFARLSEHAALNPDTMDERLGAWGQLLALFRLIHAGHPSNFVIGRGGDLFDPDKFLFLEGRADKDDAPRVLRVSDGAVLRILRGLMTIEEKATRTRVRLSYRTLDVEQLGSVYETVMGFTVELARGPMLAIKAGKNNRTPVFVNLEALLAKKGKERIKSLKEESDRAVTAKQAQAIEKAAAQSELAEAFDGIVDERGSPEKRIVAAGAPILQPTDERRRTGSHYTPRSLTEPIVRHALEPIFERLGPDAKPEDVLELKVCDPAMGSGAFLVEATRALAARVVQAWARWPQMRPTIPPDEDEELHARRLVVQRCIYGVDKNALAVDLAKLSLWLATLAREHEFTFLDHALKYGDSLVGLTVEQISKLAWDAKSGGKMTVVDARLRQDLPAVLATRMEIRTAPDDTTLAHYGLMHKDVENRLNDFRLIGHAVIAAFFSGAKDADRLKALEGVKYGVSVGGGGWQGKLKPIADKLRLGEHPIAPFHWELEFPEVFLRDRGGFDAIVGNPPFAGKNTTIAGNRAHYLPWLQTLHEGAHGNADLVAHFFRRAFGLLREGGAFGLIATNTIGQGDTRDTGLAAILACGGEIIRATRRLKWPGEAAVVVSVAHVAKKGPDGASVERQAVLDGRPVPRISAYLVAGDLDRAPARLAANARMAFQGSIVLGMGFTFDDAAAAKGEAESLETMRALISKDPHSAARIKPYLGGDELNNDPQHRHHRYVIDFEDFPLVRVGACKSWAAMTSAEQSTALKAGIVPADYNGPAAGDWPELLEILDRFVRPEREKLIGHGIAEARRKFWWRHASRAKNLYAAIAQHDRVIAVAMVSPHLSFCFADARATFTPNVTVFASSSQALFATLQSRTHELWARSFGSTLEDRIKYSSTDCFSTFPISLHIDDAPFLAAAGAEYRQYRADLMVERNEGLTKTYNRFHNHDEAVADIVLLRELHAEMDRAVLAAYGWDDLAARAAPDFLDETNEDDHTYQGRLFWPADFRDEVLARLLALNAERHEDEVRRGIAPGMKGARASADDDAEDFDAD
jgi:hypothetical protein